MTGTAAWDYSGRGPHSPVDNESRKDAQEVVAKLPAREGSMAYRLPTEPKWEYAAWVGRAPERRSSSVVVGIT